MTIWIVVAEAECCCGSGVHEGPSEIVGVFYVKEHAEARAADLVLAAGKQGKTLSVQESEVV